MSAKEIHSYLSRLLYDRRSRFNPLWNSLVVGGLQRDGSSFLGVVDMLGASYEENYLATGFGAYMALPMMRARWVPDMEEAEARTLLEDCMRVLVYRDCYSLNRVRAHCTLPATASLAHAAAGGGAAAHLGQDDGCGPERQRAVFAGNQVGLQGALRAMPCRACSTSALTCMCQHFVAPKAGPESAGSW